LDLMDDTLEAFLRATVPLGPQDVDVSFAPPDRDWSAKLNRPTVNAFLWDIRRSLERARAGSETFERDGRLVRRMSLPRIELRYLVTAWTSDHGDERALLAGVMRTVLAHSFIPDGYLPEALRGLTPIELQMATSGEQHMEVLDKLEGQLKPGINVIVFAPVDTGVFTEAGPPTTGVTLRTTNLNNAAVSEPPRRVAGKVADPGAVGAVVRSPRGSATVNPAGGFVLPAAAGDEIVLETDPPRRTTAPAVGGVVFE
jgi:hypothetical protein